MEMILSKVQQLLAETKFVEAQKAVEQFLIENSSSQSSELLELYFESLRAQSKPLPPDYVFSLIEKLLISSPQKIQKWIDELNQHPRFNQQLLVIKIQLAEMKGQTEILYKLISDYHLSRFENYTPSINAVVESLAHKYFPHDFHIQLQVLALKLKRLDLNNCESLILDLIISCYEKSTPRGTKEKLQALYNVLSSAEKLHYLEVYKNFCFIMTEGISDKKDYKKVVELIIYAENFKFQVLVLNFLDSQKLGEAVQEYANEIRNNKDYSYVYLDKFFNHLKPFFFQRISKAQPQVSAALPEIDLKLSKTKFDSYEDASLADVNEEEVLLSHLLKHQNFSTNELLDIAVSFVQSELYYAAYKASQLAYESTEESTFRLKANYLKITCLLKTGDFRSALDISLDALGSANTQNDLLSFMYVQAEAYFRLKEFSSAKSTLKKILLIDENYRLAKERLERLNAI